MRFSLPFTVLAPIFSIGADTTNFVYGQKQDGLDASAVPMLRTPTRLSTSTLITHRELQIQPFAQVDFSQGEDCPTCSPYSLEGGAQILPAPEGVQALRIPSDGPYAKIPNINIGPSYMPQATLTVGVYLVSIANDRGWIFTHESGNYDRGIVLHDDRFGTYSGQGVIASGVGKAWNPWSYSSRTTGTAPTGQWFHVTAVFRDGGYCTVYVNGVKSSYSTIEANDEGLPDLYVGRPITHTGHWANAWVKEVKVYNTALSDSRVLEESNAFHGSFATDSPTDIPSSSPSDNPSDTPSDSPSDIPSSSPSDTPSKTPSDSPSDIPSLSPSDTPSDTPSDSPSDIPSSSPSDIPSSTPSDVPSLAPSFPSWVIANATFTDHLNQETSYITLTHDIGTANSDLKVTLYEYDCETVVTNDGAVSLDDDKISGRIASYDVELARGSVGSSAFLEGGDELQFCVGAGLHVPTADLPVGVNANDYGSIVSKKTKITIAFDLTDATFTVTQFETQGENPAETDITADDNFYEMEACICSTSFTCDSATGSVPTQEENSVVFICLKPPTGLNFEGYNMIFSKGNGPVADSDFSYDAIGAPFTSEETEGNMIRVRTQLLSGLFDVGEQGTAQVSGTGNFVFDTNTKDGKEDEVEGNFKMFVGLQEVEECKPSFFVEILSALGMENVF